MWNIKEFKTTVLLLNKSTTYQNLEDVPMYGLMHVERQNKRLPCEGKCYYPMACKNPCQDILV